MITINKDVGGVLALDFCFAGEVRRIGGFGEHIERRRFLYIIKYINIIAI